jgi:hypothetical protein
VSGPSLSWLFSSELPLPAGLEIAPVRPVAEELGQERLAEAGKLLGPAEAKALAEKLGAYEVETAKAKELGLEGIRLGRNGELPALSPARWARDSGAESWEALKARLKETNATVAGLSLSPDQRQAFLRFLARNRKDPEGAPGPERMVELARHFFFSEPLNVVLRYTGPRFHHA